MPRVVVPATSPRKILVSLTNAALIGCVRQRVWDYLAAWDPEGVGRYQTETAAALEARRAEMERRLEATRSGADILP